MVVYLLNSMKIFLSYSEIYEIDLRIQRKSLATAKKTRIFL